MASPFSINGGACVAMTGKNCVAIACDLRLGMQNLTISNNFSKIFSFSAPSTSATPNMSSSTTTTNKKSGDEEVTEKEESSTPTSSTPTVYLGLTGLATDISTVHSTLRYKTNLYRLREERPISPKTFAQLISTSLYERRFGPWFVSPVVAGLDGKTGDPFICGFDSIGCIDYAKDFIVSGTASDQLFGTCEGLWEEGLEPEELFETVSQALLNATDRDALSGWGAHVYIIEKDKVTKRLLKGRQD
ncbi:MAG: proteasome core particle subunit beta 3 [Alyxoria varia]|nr:MAG: proteasome core particle subunit beta 3 [Alyxoria varia]